MAALLRDNPWLTEVINTELNAALAQESGPDGIDFSPKGRYSHNGSTIRVSMQRDQNEPRHVQLLRFEQTTPPFIAELSDSVTIVTARFLPYVTEQFAKENQKSLADGTTGAIFQLLEYDIMFPLSPPVVQILVKAFKIKGSGGWGRFGKPTMLEDDENIMTKINILCTKHEQNTRKGVYRRQKALNPLLYAYHGHGKMLLPQAPFASQALSFSSQQDKTREIGETEGKGLSLPHSQELNKSAPKQPPKEQFEDTLLNTRKKNLLSLLGNKKTISEPMTNLKSPSVVENETLFHASDQIQQSTSGEERRENPRDVLRRKKRTSSVLSTNSNESDLPKKRVVSSESALEVDEPNDQDPAKITRNQTTSLERKQAQVWLDSIHRGSFSFVRRIPTLSNKNGDYTRVSEDQGKLLKKPQSWHYPEPGYSTVPGNLPVQLRHSFDLKAEKVESNNDPQNQIGSDAEMEELDTVEKHDDIAENDGGTDSTGRSDRDHGNDSSTSESEEEEFPWPSSPARADETHDTVPPDSSGVFANDTPEELVEPKDTTTGSEAKESELPHETFSKRERDRGTNNYTYHTDVHESSDMEMSIPQAFTNNNDSIRSNNQAAGGHPDSAPESFQSSRVKILSSGEIDAPSSQSLSSHSQDEHAKQRYLVGQSISSRAGSCTIAKNDSLALDVSHTSLNTEFDGDDGHNPESDSFAQDMSELAGNVPETPVITANQNHPSLTKSSLPDEKREAHFDTKIAQGSQVEDPRIAVRRLRHEFLDKRQKETEDRASTASRNSMDASKISQTSTLLSEEEMFDTPEDFLPISPPRRLKILQVPIHELEKTNPAENTRSPRRMTGTSEHSDSQMFLDTEKQNSLDVPMKIRSRPSQIVPPIISSSNESPSTRPRHSSGRTVSKIKKEVPASTGKTVKHGAKLATPLVTVGWLTQEGLVSRPSRVAFDSQIQSRFKSFTPQDEQFLQSGSSNSFKKASQKTRIAEPVAKDLQQETSEGEMASRIPPAVEFLRKYKSLGSHSEVAEGEASRARERPVDPLKWYLL